MTSSIGVAIIGGGMAGRAHAAGYYYRRVIANWPDTQMAETAKAELARRLPKEAGK